MRTIGVLLALGLLIVSAAPAGAEVLVGLSAGVVISGEQDITFKEYSASGTLLRTVGTSNVDESIGPIAGAAVTAWADQGLLRHFALQLEALYWHVDAEPAPTPPAPSFTVGQDRTAIFLSALGRLPIYPSLGRFSSQLGSDTFAYVGAGAGPVYTAVQHGETEWNVGFQLVGGVAIPLTSQLQFRVESRYLLAYDADSSPEPGWRVDTSGTPDAAGRLGPHLDTRFFPVLFGLDWRF